TLRLAVRQNLTPGSDYLPQLIPAAASLAGSVNSKSKLNDVLSRLPTILPDNTPPGLMSPVIFSTLKSLGASTTRWIPASGALAWFVLMSIDLIAVADAAACPPPG